MPESHEGPDSLEGMAFQLVLQKLAGLERAMQATVPLLKKIVDQLEAQAKQPEVEVATYADLYPELPQEAGGQAETTPQPPQEEIHRPPVSLRRRVWHWFLKET